MEERASVQGIPAGVDVASVRFGIRTVSRDAQNRILVNGVPTFLRGTNWIGSLYFASFTEEQIRRDLELMRRAHINAIRVHAHVASKAFYRLCDELGMMVWQDFPLQWGYDDSAAFAEDAARQAREMVATLYDHPSVVQWSAMNEAPWSSDWMVWKYKDYDPDQNRLLAQKVRDAIALADSSRPTEGNAHPAQHAWSGWYEGNYTDFAKPTPHAILTEFGAQAVPQVSTLKTFLTEGELWPVQGPNLAKWEYHNFQLRELRDIAHVPLGGSVEELVANTQAYQARLLQFAAENLRRQKWQPVTAVFQFMFVEHWASMNWGIVDYLRHPKPGYGALARAYQPVLPILASKANAKGLSAYIINDTHREIREGWLAVATKNARGGTSRVQRILVDVPAGGVMHVTTSVDRPLSTETLTLELRNAQGRVLAENVYSPGYFERDIRK